MTDDMTADNTETDNRIGKPKLEVIEAQKPDEPELGPGVPHQREMPFAVVDGEPITQLRINPAAWKYSVQVFD